MNVSVVVVTYRRLESLDLVLASWLRETPDVWLCDCSREGFKTSLPVKIVRAVPDPGNMIRHAVATMTTGDLVIKADDDILAKPGIVNDFIRHYQKFGDCIMGMHGRIFKGREYYKDTALFGAARIQTPMRVDFLGIITCTSRKFLAMDLKGCESAIEDIFWQNHCYPDAPKYLIPTTNFERLPCATDVGRLEKDEKARLLRRAFYTKCYEQFYQKRK